MLSNEIKNKLFEQNRIMLFIIYDFYKDKEDLYKKMIEKNVIVDVLYFYNKHYVENEPILEKELLKLTYNINHSLYYLKKDFSHQKHYRKSFFNDENKNKILEYYIFVNNEIESKIKIFDYESDNEYEKVNKIFINENNYFGLFNFINKDNYNQFFIRLFESSHHNNFSFDVKNIASFFEVLLKRDVDFNFIFDDIINGSFKKHEDFILNESFYKDNPNFLKIFYYYVLYEKSYENEAIINEKDFEKIINFININLKNEEETTIYKACSLNIVNCLLREKLTNYDILPSNNFEANIKNYYKNFLCKNDNKLNSNLNSFLLLDFIAYNNFYHENNCHEYHKNFFPFFYDEKMLDLGFDFSIYKFENEININHLINMSKMFIEHKNEIMELIFIYSFSNHSFKYLNKDELISEIENNSSFKSEFDNFLIDNNDKLKDVYYKVNMFELNLDLDNFLNAYNKFHHIDKSDYKTGILEFHKTNFYNDIFNKVDDNFKDYFQDFSIFIASRISVFDLNQLEIFFQKIFQNLHYNILSIKNDKIQQELVKLNYSENFVKNYATFINIEEYNKKIKNHINTYQLKNEKINKTNDMYDLISNVNDIFINKKTRKILI